jgi:hypothetical protein
MSDNYQRIELITGTARRRRWVDALGSVIVRRKLKRRYVLSFFQKLPPCLIGCYS